MCVCDCVRWSKEKTVSTAVSDDKGKTTTTKRRKIREFGEMSPPVSVNVKVSLLYIALATGSFVCKLHNNRFMHSLCDWTIAAELN